MAHLFPSLMAADLLELGTVVETLEPFCDGFHIDIMDGHFVPNITFGIDMTNAIARKAQKPCWVHLMVDKPQDIIKNLQLKAGSIITFHAEGDFNKQEIIKDIHARGCKAGIALKPATDLSAIPYLLPLVDHVLIMSVEPGFSGQAYNPAVELKVKELAKYKQDHSAVFRIGIDGGINAHTVGHLKQLGVDDFAIASALFDNKDYKAACIALRDMLKNC